MAPRKTEAQRLMQDLEDRGEADVIENVLSPGHRKTRSGANSPTMTRTPRPSNDGPSDQGPNNHEPSGLSNQKPNNPKPNNQRLNNQGNNQEPSNHSEYIGSQSYSQTASIFPNNESEASGSSNTSEVPLQASHSGTRSRSATVEDAPEDNHQDESASRDQLQSIHPKAQIHFARNGFAAIAEEVESNQAPLDHTQEEDEEEEQFQDEGREETPSQGQQSSSQPGNGPRILNGKSQSSRRRSYLSDQQSQRQQSLSGTIQSSHPNQGQSDHSTPQTQSQQNQGQQNQGQQIQGQPINQDQQNQGRQNKSQQSQGQQSQGQQSQGQPINQDQQNQGQQNQDQQHQGQQNQGQQNQGQQNQGQQNQDQRSNRGGRQDQGNSQDQGNMQQHTRHGPSNETQINARTQDLPQKRVSQQDAEIITALDDIAQERVVSIQGLPHQNASQQNPQMNPDIRALRQARVGQQSHPMNTGTQGPPQQQVGQQGSHMNSMPQGGTYERSPPPSPPPQQPPFVNSVANLMPRPSLGHTAAFTVPDQIPSCHIVDVDRVSGQRIQKTVIAKVAVGRGYQLHSRAFGHNPSYPETTIIDAVPAHKHPSVSREWDLLGNPITKAIMTPQGLESLVYNQMRIHGAPQAEQKLHPNYDDYGNFNGYNAPTRNSRQPLWISCPPELPHTYLVNFGVLVRLFGEHAMHDALSKYMQESGQYRVVRPNPKPLMSELQVRRRGNDGIYRISGSSSPILTDPRGIQPQLPWVNQPAQIGWADQQFQHPPPSVRSRVSATPPARPRYPAPAGLGMEPHYHTPPMSRSQSFQPQAPLDPQNPPNVNYSAQDGNQQPFQPQASLGSNVLLRSCEHSLILQEHCKKCIEFQVIQAS